MRSVVICVAVAAVFGCAAGQDECMPPPPGSMKRTPPSSCCNMEKVMPKGIMSAAQKCRAIIPRPPKPSKPPGPPPAGEMPKELKDHHACMVQCIFNESKLLNEDKTMNEDAVKTYFTPDDSDFKPIFEAAFKKCMASNKNDIDQTLNCTSGAAELQKCVLREAFINCPSTMWTSSTDCNDLKARVVKCPNLPVKMMKGGPHPH